MLLNPLLHPEAPRSAEEIAGAQHGAGLLDHLLARDAHHGPRPRLHAGGQWLAAPGRLERKLAGLRFHLLEAEELAEAGKGSKLNATRAFLHELRDLGRARAARWIRMHRADVGRRETWTWPGCLPEARPYSRKLSRKSPRNTSTAGDVLRRARLTRAYSPKRRSGAGPGPRRSGRRRCGPGRSEDPEEHGVGSSTRSSRPGMPRC